MRPSPLYLLSLQAPFFSFLFFLLSYQDCQTARRPAWGLISLSNTGLVRSEQNFIAYHWYSPRVVFITVRVFSSSGLATGWYRGLFITVITTQSDRPLSTINMTLSQVSQVSQPVNIIGSAKYPVIAPLVAVSDITCSTPIVLLHPEIPGQFWAGRPGPLLTSFSAMSGSNVTEWCLLVTSISWF